MQRVRKAIEKVEGAKVQQLDVGSAEISVESTREAAVLDAVQKAGYEPHLATE